MFKVLENKEFIYNIIFFISFFSITFYLLLNVYHKNKNPVISTETNTLLLILLFLIGFVVKSMLAKSTDKSSFYLVGIISTAIFIQWIINFCIQYFSKGIEKKNEAYENYFKKLGIVIFTTIINIGIVIFVINQLSNSINFNNSFSIFNDEVKFDFYYYIFFFIIFFLFSFHFNTLYTQTEKSSLILPTYLGGYILLIIFGFIIYMGIKIKLIDTNQILTTIIVLACLFSLFIYIWLYMVIDSISVICKNKKKEEKKEPLEKRVFFKFLVPLVLLSIFILIWIIDTKKWSKFECGSYLIITLILFTSFSAISAYNPNTSLLSLWLLIEWVFVTYYNWINVQNSFQCLFNS